MGKAKEIIFKICYTVSFILDSLIFSKLHIQINHEYTRKKYVPCSEYWDAELKCNPETERNSTFLYVLFDKNKVVMQNIYVGFVDQSSIDQATARWYLKVEDYVDRHLEFSLINLWMDYFKKNLSPFEDKPLQILASDGKWYSCIEVDSL